MPALSLVSGVKNAQAGRHQLCPDSLHPDVSSLQVLHDQVPGQVTSAMKSFIQ